MNKHLTLTAVSLLLIGLTMSGTAYSQVPVWEREALIALYDAAGGESWSLLTNEEHLPWLGEPGTECDWKGVYCSYSLVTMISLGNSNLSGSIPPELGNLTILATLDLHDNQLTGSIPAELGNLTTLTGLDLSGNKLSGAIPSALGNLTSLENLLLNNNQLTGSIPPELGSLINLQRLHIVSRQMIWDQCPLKLKETFAV